MSSVPEADPNDLSLPDLDSDMQLGKGPTIDSSAEFPLPSFDDEPVSADILFPADGEPTAEEMPATKAAAEEDNSKSAEPPKPASPPDFGSFDPGLDSDLADLDLDLGDDKNVLPALDTDEPAESQDADYFEAGLEPEVKPPAPPKAPAPAPEPKSKPAPPPLPSVTMAPPQAPVLSAQSMSSMPTAVAEKPKSPMPDLNKKPAEPAGLTPPGPPQASITEDSGESSIDEIFFEGGAEEAQAKEKKGGKVTREDWAEEVPVDQYVRKIKVKRKSPRKAKVRPWVPAIGVAALVVAFVASKPIFASMHHQEFVAPAMVVGSQPQGELYSGDELLGKTPIALTTEMAAKPDLQIRKAGYNVVMVPDLSAEGSGDKPVKKLFSQLQAETITLAWDGLPKGSTLWWNGQKTAPEKIGTVEPGEYSVKVKPKTGPSITTKVSVTPGAGGTFSVGAEVKKAFELQPKATVALKLPDEKSKADGLSVILKSLNKEQPYQTKFKLSGGATAQIPVPKAGKYKVSFAGDKAFKAASQEVELAQGQNQEISLALAKQPEKVVNKPTSQPTYRPSTPSYRPTYRPVYRPRPSGGGGGGRIAPPAF